MNNTNRAFNRLLLLIVGLVLVVLGGAAIAIASWPLANDLWTSGGRSAQTWLQTSAESTAIANTTLSWIVLGIIAVLIVLAVLLIVALARLGGRHSRGIVRSTGEQNSLGRVTVTDAFVSDALQSAFDTRDEILFARISSNDVRDQPVLHVSVSPRQNTSPRAVVADVDELVDNLSTLTGHDIPTYISVRSGLRTALAHDQRRLR